MNTDLGLVLDPTVCCLSHPAQLHPHARSEAVAHSEVGPVSVKHFNGSGITRVSLAIDENLVVKSHIKYPFGQGRSVERHIHKNIIPVPRTKILAFNPPLLIPESMRQQKPLSNNLRHEGLLINPVFCNSVSTFTKCACGDVRVAHGEKDIGFLRLVSCSRPEHDLFLIGNGVPKSKLIVTPDPETGIFK